MYQHLHKHNGTTDTPKLRGVKTAFARSNGHTQRKLPVESRQPLASTHIKLCNYTTSQKNLQDICHAHIFRTFLLFYSYFCLFYTKIMIFAKNNIDFPLKLSEKRPQNQNFFKKSQKIHK